VAKGFWIFPIKFFCAKNVKSVRKNVRKHVFSEKKILLEKSRNFLTKLLASSKTFASPYNII